jgi:ATP-dependent helicase/nuclease subunit A
MTMLADERDRNLIATALDQTMVVEAAAGTGKTTELVNRIISVIAEGRASIEGIVAVTFTDKAAGELRLRLRSGLETWRRREAESSPRYFNLLTALAQLEGAQINTIHGFCADILRERPVEAMLDPQFESMNESQAKMLQKEAYKFWLQRALKEPPEGVRRYLRRDVKRGPADSLYQAASRLALWRDYPAPWRRPELHRLTTIDSLIDSLREFARLTSVCSDAADRLYLSTLPARRFIDQLTASEAVAARDYDALEAQLVTIFRDRQFREPQKGRTKKYGDTTLRAEVLKAHEQLMADLRDFVGKANADLAALLHSELQDVLAVYEEWKLRLGKLDFLDLLVMARNLLRDNKSVRTDLQERFSHIFVDEFQDTDPIQAEILLLLACGDPSVADWQTAIPRPGKLFIVGDPKQAVYRFRRADVGVYQHVKGLLEVHGALCVSLTTSFRARPSLQNFINAAFESVMKKDTATLQTSYVPLSRYREDESEQPSIVALPVPDPYAQRYVSGKAVDGCLPDAVGAFTDWLIKESGWKVNEINSNVKVPIRADHICILLRRFESYGEDKARAYAQALEARDIPHLLIGGRSFHQREEVETIRAALTAIEWPDDELSVFATLRGSLFAVGDEPILKYRAQWGRLHPFRIPEGELPNDILPIKEALIVLRELHKQRNRRPVAEVLNTLLEATRAHAGFAMRPSGEQVLANVLHISELARAYQANGGISFRGFIEQLEEDAERGQVPEAPILEEGSEGVRIMTVHKAKGLEFPIVIVAGITAPLAHEDADCYIDGRTGLCAVQLEGMMPLELQEHQDEEAARNRAEGIRIAYVASTRARDLLVVPAVADDGAEKRYTDPNDWWIAPLFPAMFPSEALRRKPQLATGCPEFGRDTVLRRPADQAFNVQPIRPGKYAFPEDGATTGSSQYSIVWWDPSRLGLGKETSFAVRQEELLAKVDDSIVSEDLRAYDEWRSERRRTIEHGSQASVRLDTATRRAHRRSSEDVEPLQIEVVRCERETVRPKGPRFGALVHSILATVPLNGNGSDLEATGTLQGRILGATKEEILSAKLAAERALSHPILQRARRASELGQCRRETPVTLVEPDGTLIEGIVDLAFAEDGEWLVLDFKTDQEVEQELNAYSRQVALYAEAVAKAIGHPSRGILMVV